MARFEVTGDTSLGRELRDTGGKQNRKRYLDELGIQKYAERASGAIFTDETSKKGPSPIKLVEWCLRDADLSNYFHLALKKLENIDMSAIEEVLNRISKYWMTDLQKRFVLDFLHYNLKTLQEYEP